MAWLSCARKCAGAQLSPGAGVSGVCDGKGEGCGVRLCPLATWQALSRVTSRRARRGFHTHINTLSSATELLYCRSRTAVYTSDLTRSDAVTDSDAGIHVLYRIYEIYDISRAAQRAHTPQRAPACPGPRASARAVPAAAARETARAPRPSCTAELHTCGPGLSRSRRSSSARHGHAPTPYAVHGYRPPASTTRAAPAARPAGSAWPRPVEARAAIEALESRDARARCTHLRPPRRRAVRARRSILTSCRPVYVCDL